MRPSCTRSPRLLAALGCAFLAGCAAGAGPTPTRTPAASSSLPAAFPSIEPRTTARWVPEVVARIPHDPGAWTQGLEARDGVIYESTGLYGESTVRALDRRSGEVRQRVDLDTAHFGEGLTIVGDRLLQLTFEEETLLVRDLGTLAETDRIGYAGEGWGLCLDEDRLVMSDGSAKLTFRDPYTFAARGTVDVSRDDEPLSGLNELECVGGLVFANVWPTAEIAVIDAGDGAVVATIDASALEAEVADAPDAEALNGIAFDGSTGTFLVTGKRWPVIFEVRLVAAP
jgi:glutaminyl-peptide cyclotransferase